jgi:hypothetical protein
MGWVDPISIHLHPADIVLGRFLVFLAREHSDMWMDPSMGMDRAS